VNLQVIYQKAFAFIYINSKKLELLNLYDSPGRCNIFSVSFIMAGMMLIKDTEIKYIEPQILHDGGDCLVVLKPPGLLTQAPPGIDSMELRIKEFIRRRDGLAGATADVYLVVPHRLDRPASCAMVFCLDHKATKRLGRQFELRKVKKTYWACVTGQVEPCRATWSDYIRKIPGQPRAEIVAPDQPGARTAVLHYRVLKTYDWGSWLEIELETGRTHQIRVQAAWRGHPLLGDAFYGSTATFGPKYEDERLRAVALHARVLEYYDSKKREIITVTAATTDIWDKYVDKPLAGWQCVE